MMIELALLSCAIGGILMLLKVQWKKSLFEKRILKDFVFLSIGWICFSSLFGLIHIFDALEFSKDEIAVKVVEGVQISLRIIVAGMLIFWGIIYFSIKKTLSSKLPVSK